MSTKGVRRFQNRLSNLISEAVETLSFKEVKELIEHLPTILTVPTGHGYTPLFAACKVGNLKMVNYFLSAGLDPSLPNSDGDLPLHLAARRGHLRIVNRLLEIRNDVIDVQNNSGMTPLADATKHSFPKIVIELLNRGSCATIPDNVEYLPIHHAAENGMVEIIPNLIAADPSTLRVIPFFGKNPVYMALNKGHLAVAKLMVAADPSIVDIIQSDVTTISDIAIIGGNREMVQFLISNRMFSPENQNCSLHLAIRNNRFKLATFLLTQYPVLVSMLDQEDHLPLHLLLHQLPSRSEPKSRSSTKRDKLIRRVVRAYPEALTRPNSDQELPIWTMIVRGYQNLANTCLQVASRFNLMTSVLKSEKETTILIEAGFKNWNSTCQLILSGARAVYSDADFLAFIDFISTDTHRRTAMHYLVSNRNSEMVEVLLRAGSRAANIRNACGILPITSAGLNRDIELVATMLSFNPAHTSDLHTYWWFNELEEFGDFRVATGLSSVEDFSDTARDLRHRIYFQLSLTERLVIAMIQSS